MCQELIERGMALARAASDRALQDIDPPEMETRMPGSAASALAAAQDRARRRVPNNAVIFARLSHAVRQTLALQALIAEGFPPLRIPRPHDPDSAPPAATDDPAPAPTPAPAPAPEHGRTPPCDAALRPDWLPTLDPDSPTPIEDLLHGIARRIDAEGQVLAQAAPPEGTGPAQAADPPPPASPGPPPAARRTGKPLHPAVAPAPPRRSSA